MLGKNSSGIISSSQIISDRPCFYFGFTCIPGGLDRNVVIYDNTAGSGRAVENFIVDGSKKVDGHSHAVPVYCRNGLYVSLSGGSVVIYFNPDI